MENTLKFTFLASLNTNSGWHLYLENFLSNIKSFLATEKKKRKCTHLYPSTFREAENKLKKDFLCFRRKKCLSRCRNLCCRLHIYENSLLIFLVHGYLSENPSHFTFHFDVDSSIVLSKFKIEGPLEYISWIVNFLRTFCIRLIGIQFIYKY